MSTDSLSTPTQPPSILTLPDELLEEIFYCVIMREGPWQRGPVAQSHWRFIRVSKHWHSVVMSSPRLWCKPWWISLEHTQFSEEESHKLFLRVNFFLERSKNHPISFILEQNSRLRDESRHIAVSILSLLVKHSSQWQYVHLYLRADVALQVLPIIRGNIPLLRTLVLVLRLSTSAPSIGTFDLQCFEEAPLLRTVQLRIYSGQHSPEPIRIPMPWHQLEKYVSKTDGWEIGVRDALATSNRLLILTFTERAPVSGSGLFGSSIQVQNETLTSLDMSLAVSQSTILPHIHLPKLVDLKIYPVVVSTGGSTLLSDVHGLILRSKCKLRSLSLTARDCSEWELSSILALCEDLETLSLDVPLHVKDVQRLGSDAPPLIPRILEINLRVPFRVQSVEQCDLDPVLLALSTMARSRERIHRAGCILGKLCLTVDFQVVYELSLNHNFSTRILARLEGFSPVSSTTTLSMIQRWGQLLRELDRRRKLSLRQSYELHKMLKEMEDYPIEGSDLTLLYRTQVPRQLSTIKLIFGAEAKFLKLEPRLQNVIQSWKPILMADAGTSRRWAIQSQHFFHYLRADDERRVGDDAWKIVIGF